MNHITISLVTWNSLKYLPVCLEGVRNQLNINYELIVVDNNSTDGTVEYLEQQPDLTLICNKENLGFCEAHNIAISRASGEYVLVLNPDVFLKSDFLSQMVCAIEQDERVGQVSGKLYRISNISEIGNSKVLDSVGMYFTPNQRHFDRGAGEVDTGQYDELEYVFGVSGAAAFYRREALYDASFNNEFFDQRFFAYREDADLSWRMQVMGWRALFAPKACADHVRSLREGASRKEIDNGINMHSVKNRFLMRIKNQTMKNGLRFFIPTLSRDFMVVVYTLLFEHSSLMAFLLVLKLFPEMLEKRSRIMNNRRVNNKYLGKWMIQKAALFDPAHNK